MLHSVALFFGILAQPDVSADGIQNLLDVILPLVQSPSTITWVAGTIAAVQVAMFVLKRVKSEFTKKYGQLIVIVSSALIAVLSLVAGGNDWKAALLIFLSSGASTFIHDILHAVGALKHKEAPADSK